MKNNKSCFCGILPLEENPFDSCEKLIIGGNDYLFEEKTGFIFDTEMNHIGFGHLSDGVLIIDQRVKN